MANLLTEKDVVLLVKRYEEGPKGLMDKALIITSITLGLEMIEITDLDINHVLSPAGKLRKHWEMPSSVAYNGHRRSVDFQHPALIKVLTDHIESLAADGDPNGVPGEFLGLDPSRPVFTNKRGERFGVTKRGDGRGTATGLRTYVQDMINRSHLKGSGVTPASFRRTWIIEHSRNGMKPRDLMGASGIRSVSTLSRLIYNDPVTAMDKMKSMYSKV